LARVAQVAHRGDDGPFRHRCTTYVDPSSRSDRFLIHPSAASHVHAELDAASGGRDAHHGGNCPSNNYPFADGPTDDPAAAYTYTAHLARGHAAYFATGTTARTTAVRVVKIARIDGPRFAVGHPPHPFAHPVQPPPSAGPRRDSGAGDRTVVDVGRDGADAGVAGG
jgi:hypothetical protein